MLHGDSHSPAVCPLPAAVASGSSCVGNTPPVQDHLALDNSRQGLLGSARYNVIEYARSIRGPFEHGSWEAANQRGNKITKQTQFSVTQRESMVSGWFRVRRGGRIRKIRRIGPAGYKSSFAAGRETPKSDRAAELVARTWRCSSVRVRGRLPSNRITKQSQFLITPFVPDTYRKFGGLVIQTHGKVGESRKVGKVGDRLGAAGLEGILRSYCWAVWQSACCRHDLL